MSEGELKTLKHLVSILIYYRAHMSDVKEVDEEELCLICCAMPLAVTFNPCHHRSCKSVFVLNDFILIYLHKGFCLRVKKKQSSSAVLNSVQPVTCSSLCLALMSC